MILYGIHSLLTIVNTFELIYVLLIYLVKFLSNVKKKITSAVHNNEFICIFLFYSHHQRGYTKKNVK